jgi:predicted small lipoprotein YifL
MRNVFLYPTFLSLVSVSLAACVTINIYFPAAAAEKAADQIIEEVWQLDDAEKKNSQGAAETRSDN